MSEDLDGPVRLAQDGGELGTGIAALVEDALGVLGGEDDGGQRGADFVHDAGHHLADRGEALKPGDAVLVGQRVGDARAAAAAQREARGEAGRRREDGEREELGFHP
jgi:hypothetical protein